ncbi:MAG: helix-turn-helix domain-containing protein [Gammaproteobacteria bacterium]|nr:helix-turn-helix domain-containing protein [Gammaproteobacteria bacterium]
MSQALKIHHVLADVVIKPAGKISSRRLKSIIQSSLDKYLEEDRVTASTVHAKSKQRHGKYYRTPGYYLRLYRQRADLTQITLAKKAGMLQHHVSEMENNKRPIGKTTAKKLAKILQCEYQRFL